ncbi:unnamed protein product [Triticum turgidum subsp. durum]|uniref:DUF6598 domain-containing protein n=1 Tax=Triticum turgidum subsp. durum TaxID=4567 RepID=A0A9R0QNG0_TRITD|nr:unnamed protein product [Triticum turgidum subsp. durum]
MLQLFCMRLSSFEPLYPISVYGIFAIRDYLDPRRNYVFNRPRDDAVMIEKKVIKTSFLLKIVCLFFFRKWLIDVLLKH